MSFIHLACASMECYRVTLSSIDKVTVVAKGRTQEGKSKGGDAILIAMSFSEVGVPFSIFTVETLRVFYCYKICLRTTLN